MRKEGKRALNLKNRRFCSNYDDYFFYRSHPSVHFGDAGPNPLKVESASRNAIHCNDFKRGFMDWKLLIPVNFKDEMIFVLMSPEPGPLGTGSCAVGTSLVKEFS